MNFRTTLNIDPSDNKIDHYTPVMFIGSCFASEIGAKMSEGKMKVLINPTGVVYNPASVCSTLNIILENKVFTESDLYKYKGINISFYHYTDFTSEDSSRIIDKINSSTRKANKFLKQAGFLVITFGTARIYRFKENGKIVSNCHKLPAFLFSQEMLTVEEIVSSWNDILNRLHSFNNNLRIIFTVSPVRHWKDGAYGNQLSKSVLFLTIDKLLEHRAVEGYFPAFELQMDDLRDYRYYAEDMLHPSQTAIDYIWNTFSSCYFSPETIALWKEVYDVTKAMKHRFLSDSLTGKNEFAKNILGKISEIEKKNPHLDLSEERSYFTNIQSNPI
jgi:GSCFA family